VNVEYEHHGRVAVITINRPERRNAVDSDTAVGLREAWLRFDADGEADVAVLTGAGDHFSAGADLLSFDLVDRPEGFLGFTRAIASKPTIAAVEGYCVAGGLEMALWCDLRVAGVSSIFGCFERRFGVPLVDGGTQRLPRLVGLGMAMEMILTGRSVDADEARAIGLVNAVTDDGSALAVALDWAQRIAQFPQPTVRSDRLAVLEGLGLPMAEGLERERMLGLSVFETARRGAARFQAGAGRSGRLVGWLSPVRVAPLSEDTPGEPVDPMTAEPQIVAATAEDLPAVVDVSGPVAHAAEEAPVDMAWGLPPAASGPAVLVVPEHGPLDDQSRLLVERLSNSGFLTLAVSLPDLELETPARIGAAIDAAISRLIRHPVARGEGVGLMGSGLAGGVAIWYSTVDDRVHAVVSQGGRMPSRDFAPRFDGTKVAYLGHYGRDDVSVSPQFAFDLEMTLREKGVDATFNIYPGMGSGAFRLGAEEDTPGAALAFKRTVSFLTRSL
jgi:enoyl-CoA hydratase